MNEMDYTLEISSFETGRHIAAYSGQFKIIWLGSWRRRIFTFNPTTKFGSDEEAIVPVLNHEVLHHVIEHLIGLRASMGIDRLIYLTGYEDDLGLPDLVDL